MIRRPKPKVLRSEMTFFYELVVFNGFIANPTVIPDWFQPAESLIPAKSYLKATNLNTSKCSGRFGWQDLKIGLDGRIGIHVGRP